MSLTPSLSFTTTCPKVNILPQRQRRLTTSAVNHLTTRFIRTSGTLVRVNAAAELAPPQPTSVPWYEKDQPDNIINLEDGVQEFVDVLADNRDSLIVVDFFASWCRACRAVYPKVMKIAAAHPDVKFVCVNIEENKELAKGLGIKNIPYFHFYRGSDRRVDQFPASITKAVKIEEALERHNTPRCSLPDAGPILEEFPTVEPHAH